MLKQQAVNRIKAEISKIRYESDEDEGASDWQGHLESVLDQVIAGTMNIGDAEDDTGLFLVGDIKERIRAQNEDYGRTNFAAFGDESMR